MTVTAPDGTATAIRGRHVILATGSVPRLIPNFERGGAIMTSDEVLDLDVLPARVAVIGGGAIGCEFASTFADLGSQVTILEGLPKILPGLDADVANIVVRSFKKKKIDIRTGVNVTGHTLDGNGGTAVQFGDGESVDVDAVVVSVGRRPFADQLGLDGTGVEVDERGFVEVDEFCRTGEPGVYAVGDLINTPQLAHVGYAEAIMVDQAPARREPDARDVRPRAVGDLLPSRGCLGRARRGRRGGGRPRRRGRQAPVQVQQPGPDRRRDRGHGQSRRQEERRRTAGQVLGVHMVGPWVTEQLVGGYLAVNWEATVAEVAEFIQPHPSLSELFGETMLSLTGRDFNG